MIEMTLPIEAVPKKPKHPTRPGFAARQRRLRDEAFLAALMHPAESANREERREHARQTRRAVSALRAQARGIKQKREYRAWRKACRAARSA